MFAQRFTGFGGVGGFVPSEVQGFAALDGGPGIVGEDYDAAGGEGAFADGVDGDDIADAWNGLGFSGVKLCEFAAEDRAAGDDGVLHGERAGVDAEFVGSGGFGGG